MPRKPCYWTRKLEFALVEFVRQKEFIWRPIGNTNHHIQQKYKAYAEFAAKLGRGFTARSVRDRWVNIRSTFNQNLRRVDKSRETARTVADVYVPCWPLWKSLQFLRSVARKEEGFEAYSLPADFKELSSNLQVKEEFTSNIDELGLLPEKLHDQGTSAADNLDLMIRQRGERTDRPRRRHKLTSKSAKTKCKRVIDDLLSAMQPLVNMTTTERQGQSYWFFGKHVTERLNSMRAINAESACHDIMKFLDEFEASDNNAT